MSDVPTVTVLIPARNEEADIERCLRAVLAQDQPHDRMEIVLVDGGSTDRTAQVASRVLSEGDTTWKIIENAVGTTPSNLNAGLAVATGEYLCRVDARSIIPPEYVRLCVDVLASRSDIAVTGGAQVAVAPDTAGMARGIARALNNRYAMGGSRYRSGSTSGPADTVYLGAFRTAELRAEAGWDAVLQTNQDYELNRRMADRGVVWFDQRLRVGYVPRSSLRQLWMQYHRFGRWKVRYWQHTGDHPQRRQVVLLAAAPVLSGCLGALLVVARTTQRRAALLAASAVGLLMVEHRGSSGPAAGPMSRVISVAAMLTVGAAWVTGVGRQLLARDR